MRAGAPVIPAHVEGSYRLFPRGAKRVRAAKITVSFGPPVDLATFRGCEPTKEVYAEVGAELLRRIGTLADALPPERRVV